VYSALSRSHRNPGKDENYFKKVAGIGFACKMAAVHAKFHMSTFAKFFS
jgi:hypothetical protein